MTDAARSLVVAVVVALVVSAAGVGAVLRVARGRRLLDVPNARSSHTAPTPRGGGVAIAAAIAAGVGLAGLGIIGIAVLPFLVVGCLVGLQDDLKPIPPRAKMVVLVVAALFAAAAARVDFVYGIPFVGFIWLRELALPLTVIWLSCYANVFNFMDGINGIAALTAAVAGAVFCVAGLHSDATLAVLGGVTAAAAVGFLPWNFPSARIFMGDAGSLPLGMMVAFCAVWATRQNALPFPACVLLLGPFLFDVAFTLFRRWREGKTIGEAHKEHLYQRLSRVWDSHAKVSLLYAGFSVVTGVLALSYVSMSDLGRLLSLVLPLAAMLGFAAFVLRAEREKGR